MASLDHPPQKKQKLVHVPLDHQSEDAKSLSPFATAQAAALTGNVHFSASTQPMARESSQAQRESTVSILKLADPETAGFRGIAKKRYTDFLVNEILPSGEVVHVKCINNPRSAGDAGGSKSHERARDPMEKSGNIAAPSSEAPDWWVTQQKLKEVEESSETRSKSSSDGLQTGPSSSTVSQNKQVAFEQWKNSVQRTATKKIRDTDRHFLGQFLAAEALQQAEDLFERVQKIPNRGSDFYGTVKLGKVESKTVRVAVENAAPRIFANLLKCSSSEEGVLSIKLKPVHRKGVQSGQLASNERRKAARKKKKDARRKTGGKQEQESIEVQAPESITATRKEGQSLDADWLPQGHSTSQDPVLQQMRSQKKDPSETAQTVKDKQKTAVLDFVHFSLFKENRDTNEVIAWMANSLHLPFNAFRFAGTKDRRAVTVQRVSAPGGLRSRLAAMSSYARAVLIGDFEYQPSSLGLGELTGNEFIITVRDVDFEGFRDRPIDKQVLIAQERVNATMSSLCARGFLNYFGLQRFGTHELRTDMIGIKLLSGNFQGVVDCILDVDPAILSASKDPEDRVFFRADRQRAEVIHEFRTSGRPSPALRTLSKRFVTERLILEYLTSHPRRKNDWSGAVAAVPRSQRMLYLHAYQSIIWNLAATERWSAHGAQVVEGDLIIDPTSRPVGEPSASETSPSDLPLESVDADGELIVTPAMHDRAPPKERRFDHACALTADEAASGAYSIFDVVLPMPGQHIKYPPNLEDFYVRTMRQERFGGLDAHNMPTVRQGLSLAGIYRTLLARPGSDWDARVVTYRPKEERQLVLTDRDRLVRQANLEVVAGPGPESAPNLSGTFDDKGLPQSGQFLAQKELLIEMDEPKLAAVIRMQLGAGTYATMALREMSKGGIEVYDGSGKEPASVESPAAC